MHTIERHSKPLDRILVYRTGHLGDTVCAIPAFRLVRKVFPTAQITLLCDRPSGAKVFAAEVADSLGVFDRVVDYQSRRGLRTALALWRAIRRIRPETAIILPGVRETQRGIWRKVRFFRRCGVKDIRAATPPMHSGWQKNEPARLIELLHQNGIPGEKPDYDIPIDAQARASIMRQLTAAGVNAELPFLVFCGGGKAQTQCWPLERYADVLSTLPWPVVTIGTDAELTSYREQLVPRSAALRLLPKSMNVNELVELLRLAVAYIGNDTGPMHVAAAVGCPVAAVISGRNAPGMWDPDVEPRLVFRHRTECENCFLQDCLAEQHRCMTSITVDQVLAELLPFLRSLSGLRHSTLP